jgi:hypothetical protein
MTKLRAPVTMENTLYRVLGELGIERAAAVTGRAEAYLRNLSDPDKREELTVRDLRLLDSACRAAGDPTFPLYQTLGLLLEADGAERFADAAALGRHAELSARESGEASAALIAACLAAGSDDQAHDRALREAEQAHEAWADTIATLRQQRQRPVVLEQPP